MTEFSQIREALNFIPADERDLWLRIGMAIKSDAPPETRHDC
jgi:hypothetical protein